MPPDIFKMEMFENTQAFRLRVDRRKRRFSNTMMFRILLACPFRVLMYLHRFSVFVCVGGGGRKRYKRAKQGCVFFLFFENGEEISVFKHLISGFVWTEPYFDQNSTVKLFPATVVIWILF